MTPLHRSYRDVPSAPAKGFSLIELMVAIVIGIVLLLGLGQIFVAGKTAYQSEQGSSFMQENARFAMAQIDYSAQMADHWGANNPNAAKITTGAKTALAALYTTCVANYITDETNPFWWTLGIDGIDHTQNPAGVLGCLPADTV